LLLHRSGLSLLSRGSRISRFSPLLFEDVVKSAAQAAVLVLVY
jgi:hypothetical protein